MTKDWSRFKSRIEALYIQERKSLKEVRRQMHKEHDFFASTRAYRIRLDAWGFRKNKKILPEAKGLPLSQSSVPVEFAVTDPQYRNVAFFDSRDIQENDRSPESQGSRLHVSSPSLNLQSISTSLGRGETSPNQANLFRPPNLAADQWLGLELHDLEDSRRFNNTAANSLLELSRDQALGASIHPASSKEGDYLNTLLGGITGRRFSHLRELLGKPEAAATRKEDLNTLLRLVAVEETKEPHESSCDVARLLLKFGASPISPGSFSMTSLHIAVQRVPSLRLLELLLEFITASNSDPVGVDPVDSDGNTPLLSLLHNFSISSTDSDVSDFKPHVELLLKTGANPNHRSKSGWTPFCLALKLQTRTPKKDVMNLALFMESGANLLNPMPSGEAPLEFFLNSMDWLSTPGMEESWSHVTLSFLKQGADPYTLVGTEPLLSYCLQHVLFFPKENLQIIAALLNLSRLICQLVSCSLRMLQKPLHFLTRILSITTEDLEDISLDCIKALVAVDRPSELSEFFNIALSALDGSQIHASRISRLVEVFLDAGINPLWPNEFQDRSLFVALKRFDGDLQFKVTHLLLERSVGRRNTALGSVKQPDFLWFREFADACDNGTWILNYERRALPQDLTGQQKSVLVNTARVILAHLCIKHAIAKLLRSESSNSDKDLAWQQVLDIIHSPQYQELGRVPTSHVEGLLRLGENALLDLQQSQRAAVNESTVLRYKNSLLEHILLDKGINVQAELRAREI